MNACQNCGASKSKNGNCEYCGGKVVAESSKPAKRKKMEANHLKIDTLKDTLLVGNFNKIEKAINCKIEGSHNKINLADENVELSGNFNKVKTWRRSA